MQRILSVDDNETDLFVHERVIYKHDPSITVVDVADGQAAFDVLEKGDFWPDLILLDVNMPVLDGFGFIELCHAAFGKKTPPIVLMLSSLYQDRDIDRIPDFPAIVGYMLKPLSRNWHGEISAMLAAPPTM